MDRWSQLSMSEKSDLMSLYIQNGISSLEEIKKHYNSYDNGGNINKDITEVLNDVPSWKQGLATEQHIPHVLATREQYIQNQRDAVRQIAYQNSLERTEPEQYKTFRKVKDEEIPLYKELITAAETILNNPIAGNKEKQQAKSDITVLKDVLRRGSVYEDEVNCIYTALTNYGKQYRVPGNQSFRANPAKYGFKEINLDDVKQGDIIQYLGRGVPKHGAIYSKSEDGKILANYSNGTTEYRKNAYYGYNPKYAYRFIGLPEDLSRWNQEYNNLINSFATGGHLYRDGGPDEPNFVGGATALKKDYNYELEHLADKYAVTASGPWHDYGIHNPSPSQRAHWNELSRMYNRVAQRPNYQRLNPINIAEYAPVVGDAIDTGYSLYDLQQGNTSLGLAGLGMLAVPNIIEKPIRLVGKATKNLVKNINKRNSYKVANEVINDYIKRSQGKDIYTNALARNEEWIRRTNEKPVSDLYDYTISFNPFKYDIKKHKDAWAYYTPKDRTIYINPKTFLIHPKKFGQTIAHETRHRVQDRFINDVALSQRVNENLEYPYLSNKTNPLFKNGSIFDKYKGTWMGDPSELDAEMIGWKQQLGKLNTSFIDLPEDLQKNLVDVASKKFEQTQEDIGRIVKNMSRLGYFKDGGKIK